jgi:hypothetical protein
MNFVNAANARNPIDQFETSRVGNLVVNAKLVNMMNSKTETLEDSFILLNFPQVLVCMLVLLLERRQELTILNSTLI